MRHLVDPELADHPTDAEMDQAIGLPPNTQAEDLRIIQAIRAVFKIPQVIFGISSQATSEDVSPPKQHTLWDEKVENLP